MFIKINFKSFQFFYYKFTFELCYVIVYKVRIRSESYATYSTQPKILVLYWYNSSTYNCFREKLIAFLKRKFKEMSSHMTIWSSEAPKLRGFCNRNRNFKLRLRKFNSGKNLFSEIDFSSFHTSSNVCSHAHICHVRYRIRKGPDHVQVNETINSSVWV